ncbi:MAG: multiheme c-type cytochrome [Armatimonadota bacterium]|nr:hypothetical protein [Armatimonadota bacterium]MDW8024517.1 multiheme c-type cytochrome [Armatimonadota bacterium]
MKFRSTHILLLALITIVIIGIIANFIITSQRAIINRPPDIEILVTGKMRGRFEFCGCPGERAQSLPMRAQAIKGLTLTPQLRERLLLIESGNFTSDRESVEVAMRSFKMLGYDLVSTAQSEQFYIDEVLSQARKLNMKLLARDIKGNEGLSDICKPVWVLSRSQYKVAFVTSGIQPKSNDERTVMAKWNEVMNDVKSASGNTNAVILMNYWDWGLIERVLKETDAGKFITAIITHTSAQQLNRPEFQTNFETHFLLLPERLLPMPLLRLWIHRGKVRHLNMTTYSPSVEIPDEEIKMLVSAYYRKRQERLKAQWLTIVRRAKEYTTPKECAKCHESEYRHWMTTKHATAVLTLKKRHRIEPDCLKCHSEEFIQTKRLTMTDKGSGVECVSCHVELKDPVKVKEHGHMPSERARPPRIDPIKVCTPCHDKEHSPQFDVKLSDYMSKVRH